MALGESNVGAYSFDLETQNQAPDASRTWRRSFGLGAVTGALGCAGLAAVAYFSQPATVHANGHGMVTAFAPTGGFYTKNGFESVQSRTADPEAKWAPAWKTALENPPARPTSAPKVEAPAAGGKEDFLEFSPYYDKSTMPNNVYKIKDPFEGKIVSVKKIVGPQSTGETYDVIIDHGGKMPYIEGQSYGVIAPGVDAKGKPHKVRLYSIASSRYGDDQTGKTTTLCVRRATYWCPELKAEDPAKKGVCSNYLCDAKAGDAVKLTGPSGKVMLLPEDKPETDIIMVATGTGIAPMRSFLYRIFKDETPYAKDFKGLAWLFLGVANTDALLYDDEWKEIAEKQPDKFRYDVALSREMKNKDGGKLYIQDKVEEYADEIFTRLDNGAHIYFCGLKGMMPGIQDMLKRVAESKGLDYDEFIKKLKKSGQWHVEVY